MGQFYSRGINVKTKILIILFTISLLFSSSKMEANSLLKKINSIILVEEIFNSYKEIEVLKNININYLFKNNCKSKIHSFLVEKKLKIKLIIDKSEKCSIEIFDKINYTIELNIKLAENLKLCRDINNDFTSTGSIDYKLINPSVKLPINIIPIRDFIYLGFVVEQNIIFISKNFDSYPIESRFSYRKSISNPSLSNPLPASLTSSFPNSVAKNTYLGIYFLTTPIEEKYLSASVFFSRRFVVKIGLIKCYQKVEWQVTH